MVPEAGAGGLTSWTLAMADTDEADKGQGSPKGNGVAPEARETSGAIAVPAGLSPRRQR